MSKANVSDEQLTQPRASDVGVPPGFISPSYDVSDGQLFHPRTEDVRVVPGFNPRGYFDQAEHNSLTASVAEEGVVQAILVRPEPNDPSKFRIIAGERRWRAACAAGLETIPAIYREVNDRRALAIANLENYERAAVSPAEEAKLARRMLDGCDGDRDTATKELGWPRSRFDARLALNHGTAAVLEALASRQIKVGHAELLTTLPAETQEGTLAKVLEDQISVIDLKAKLASFTHLLSAAIFDKGDCACCPHNSSLQATLFEETLGEGRCANRACFGAKSAAALRQQQDDLSDEYNCVLLDLDRSPETWTPLCKTGSNGVGAEQYSACQGCEHFGALISSKPGEEGQVERGICFHLPCNTEKVAEQQQRTSDKTSMASNTDASQGGTTAKGTGVGKRPTASKRASTAIRPRKIEEAVDTFLRKTASDTVKGDPKLIKALALYALLKEAEWPTVQPDGLEALDCRAHTRPRALEQCYPLDEGALDEYLVEAACHLIEQTPDQGMSGPKQLVNTAITALQVANCDVTGVFTLDEGFLRTHTKAGITSLMQEPLAKGEPSFASKYDKKFGKGAFVKLMKQKTDVIVKRILGAGFDFASFVPRCVSERLEAKKKRSRG